LSKKIEISSFLRDQQKNNIFQKFSFLLDRDATKKPQMIEKYQEIFKIFKDLDDETKCPYINNYTPG